MPQSRSKYQFYQEASLSQKLAHKMPEYSQYAGTDQKTSLKIMRMDICAEFGILNKEDFLFRLTRAFLDGQRKVLFATSELVNEITKMGLQMPKTDEVHTGVETE